MSRGSIPEEGAGSRRRAARRALGACAAIAVMVSGCAASVPLPREGDHVGERPVIVGEPPPPPKVEVVPPAPDGMRDAVWVSGQWQWSGRRWEWREGRWELQAEGATYAAPRIVYLSDRTIGWFPGRWRAPAR